MPRPPQRLPNKHKGEVAIRIGGRERILRFGFDQLAQLEQRLGGRSIFSLLQSNNFGLSTLRESLFVGLLESTPGLTLEHVTRWLEKDYSKLGEHMRSVANAITAAFPRKEGTAPVEDLDGDDDKAAPGDGPLADLDADLAEQAEADLMAQDAAERVSEEWTAAERGIPIKIAERVSR